MMLRLLRRLFSADVLGLILVLLALQTLTNGILASLRGTDTRYLFEVCLVAALIGFGLSRFKFNGIASSVWIGAVGIVGVWILGARLAYPLLDVLKSIYDLIPQIVPAIREQIQIDTSAMADEWTIVMQSSAVLATRWQTWFLGMDRNVNDALIRDMIWTLLLWLLAAWTGWFAARRNAILALMPNIILLALVISYSERKVETLWLLVFILLLLMGLWNYKNHTTQWQRRKVDYSDSIRYDNTQAVLFLAISIGIITFITPSISWREIRDLLRERNNSNQAAEMLGIQQQTVASKNTFVQKPSLPREHLLTEGFAQSQELVMTIRTGELPPIPNTALTADPPRYYWRDTIYDHYMGAGWVTSSAPPQKYKANTPLIPGLLNSYRSLHLDVKLRQPEGKLFWSGMLYSADVPIRADWRVRPQSSLFADQTALLQADMFVAATTATSYNADVFVPFVTEQGLRDASTEYPPDIIERYLALPRDVPERVHQLAKEIAGDIENPYDKAKAIEGYLRTNYPYDLEVPPPPEDQDVADYFLFDLKKGYCDYYATAMVVLARSSGLPARFVSGYSSGSYDAPNAQYVVRELNAHSWAEVYFPAIGWIEFEPTGSQPEIKRAEENSQLFTGTEPITPASRFLFQLTNEKVLYWLSPFIIAMILIVLYYAVVERILFMSIAPLKAIEILYQRFYRFGRPLAGEYTRAETAQEFKDKLIRTLEEINHGSKQMKSSKRIQTSVEQLTELYQSSLFTTYVVGKQDTKLALQVWKRLRRLLLRARIKQFLLDKIEWVRNKVVQLSYKSL